MTNDQLPAERPASGTDEVAVRPTGDVVPGTEDAAPEATPYVGASAAPVTPEQAAVLREPVPADAYDIKPTGEVFVSHVHYRRILNKAFGPLGWAIIPQGPARIDQSDNQMYRPYALYADGRFVSEAIGECSYQPDNRRMSYADAAEGVKSNALTRCCKDLSIASECWDRGWATRWRNENCVAVFRKDRRVSWRRKDTPKWHDESGYATYDSAGHVLPDARAGVPQNPSDSAQVRDEDAITPDVPRGTSPDAKITDAQRKRLRACQREGGHEDRSVKLWLKGKHGLDSSKDILVSQYDDVCERLRYKEPLYNDYDQDVPF
jgi:hypothetical protein